MYSCPSCGAPLDLDGICTACGALSRGFFRELDLGTPQIADAVARGLDFYRLLDVPQDTDTRTIAWRYRRLRTLFPDNPSALAPEPAKRLALLEVAGRVLTDPKLRQSYDDLRLRGAEQVSNVVLRCASCAAPCINHASCCPYCGTPYPEQPAAPNAPPTDGPVQAEPIDYYALLEITPEHLNPAPSLTATPSTARGGSFQSFDLYDFGGSVPARSFEPPNQGEIDAAALEVQRRVLLAAGYQSDEREAKILELEVAQRILRTPRWREQYDQLLLDFRRGVLDRNRLAALRSLQDSARAEIVSERGGTIPAAEAQGMLAQGVGLLRAGMPREAMQVLQAVVRALPQSVEAHAAYARAIFASDDPLRLGGHALRQALTSIEAAGALLEDGPALAAVCRGLLARDTGDVSTAQAELRQAASLAPHHPLAWRGLAALAMARGDHKEALAAAHQGLAANPQDEPTLLFLIAVYLRTGQDDVARDMAHVVAQARGGSWAAGDVLREL